MRSAIVSVFAAGAFAQLTLPPLHNLAAIQDNADCGTIVPVVSKCFSQFGGSDGLSTADPQELMGCACCDGGSPISNAYKGCSDDLAPTSSSAADVYGTIYSLCGAAECSGSATASDSITAAPTSTSGSSIDGPGNSDGCYSMLDMFSQCVSETDGFSDLPFASQAPCYCCSLSRGNTVWHDQLDSYARTCAAWATTASPGTVYSAASRFQSFCNKFTDACEATATASDDSSTASETETETEASATEESTDNSNAVTVTATPGPATTTADAGDAGVQLRVGAVSGLVVISALLFAF